MTNANEKTDNSTGKPAKSKGQKRSQERGTR